MFFSLGEFLPKVCDESWSGAIHFYPSQRTLSQEHLTDQINWLEANVPLKFGDRVVVIAAPQPETVVTMLWLWNKGAVVVPVKHYTGEDETERKDHELAIHKIADDCHAIAVVSGQKATLLEPSDKPKSVFKENSVRKVVGSDLALIIYTSGSTGKPKGIMLSHNNVITAMFSIATYLRIDKEEHILGLSPLSFDYGLYQLLFCLAFDCQFTLFEDNFHPVKVLKSIEEQKISLIPVVPTMASSLIQIIRVFKKSLPSLRKLTNTGGHLGETVIDEYHSLLPQLDIFPMYGLTECKRALYLPPEHVEDKRGSVGIAIPGLEAKLFNTVGEGDDMHFEEVATGEIGELYVRGSTVMQGYYGQAGAGANVVPGLYRDDNWLATGDLFAQDEDGYFFFKGRSKELIKQAGFCIYPTESEAMIEKHDLVHLAAIVPSTDKYGDEIACLCVQLDENNDENQKAFNAWLKTAIDGDYRPREVRFIDEMALTPNSKVDKKSLIATLEN